ncbi:serine/threonine protein phosphatase PrpC [Chitinivorax tropicus]|uniref:Serine/threonine protein phosphatase PrpC n=1 Tax=Chitinivorax tropicus TaxID=714531 RepID=A0A840MBT8_9PROT|nr:protein phosphatase 2C domain-containing protein [Chitinivorax tropicus]MBB5016794.1 serine/threonine protein phosphatase PrpC [Chitinivorax tropicus]
MKFSIYQESRRGARKYNQDRIGYSYSRDALLLVVADGMGGHLHGEVASQITIELLAGLFQKRARPVVPAPLAFLQEALTKAHDAILNYSTNHNLLETPRTTCIACLVQDSTAYWAHAGDSRLYHFRDGKILSHTRDHSKVQQMVENGLLTEEEAMRHPERNKIYSCLGGMIPPEIDFGGKVPLYEGDSLVLCTDGFWGPLPADEMCAFLGSYPVLYALPQLMDRAEMRGGKHGDNLSVLGITWLEEDTAADTKNAVHTKTLPLDGFTTRLKELNADQILKEDKGVSEMDIEAAIAEIRATIAKYSK